ncbi:MAG TPA: nitroreductase family protein [Chloroflexia bacterium]|nr:nitroreductase family protein [Chloroflexia bacterium]
MNVSEAISRKRAVRSFAPKPLPEDVVNTILWAGRRAQSSKNTQPRFFIAVRERETLVAISKMGDFASWLPEAALCVLILTPDPKQRWSIMFDAGQSAAYMQLAAVELGVASCLITLHHPEPARELFGFPEDLELNGAIAFGYPADPGAFEPPARPGGRLPIGDIAHFERWGG